VGDAVNLFDLILVLLAIGASVGGYRLGMVARLVSWVGLVAGVLLGAAILPALMRRLHDASDVSLVLVAVATLLGTALVGQGIGLTLGSRLHIALPDGPVRQADRGAGAVLGVIGVLVGLWLLLPTLASVPGWTAEQARGSRIAREVNDTFPKPPDTIQALRRVVGDEPFPQVFDALQPAPDPGPPPAASGLTDAVASRAVQSVVKVEGIACNRIQEGSGFVVAEGTVVTNAHVVAGEDETEVELDDGSKRDATVVAFDPSRDIAVLQVDELDRPPLNLRDAKVADIGGVFGHPGGGPLEISPFKVGDQITAVGTDIYDRDESRRQVLVLASDLAPGDSGAAMVDTQGSVVGIAFAVAPDKPGVAYALALEELREVLATDLTTPRDTGDCLL
jgi:S1-C subfamily serine protease